MSALRCPQCGLVNFATATACKRCKYPISNPPPVVAAQSTYGARPAGFQPRWSASNGYAPPRQEHYARNDYRAQAEYSDAPPGVWRDGSLLVMTEDSVLPERCVRCNAPAQQQLKRKLEWYPRYIIYVFIFIRLLGIILYLLKRKRATIYIGLCNEHASKRRNGMMAGTILILVSVLFVCASIATEEVAFIFPALLSILAGLVMIATMVRTVTADKIDEPYIWVKGVHKDYLHTLPAIS